MPRLGTGAERGSCEGIDWTVNVESTGLDRHGLHGGLDEVVLDRCNEDGALLETFGYSAYVLRFHIMQCSSASY